MKIGVPKEIKNHEYRVGLTPAAVGELVRHGHRVLVQASAGAAIGFTDPNYQRAGAEIAPDAESLFRESELIVKVKEPQAEERQWLGPRHTLFTYLHLAPDRAQTHDLLDSGATCIAYETVTDPQGRLPLLAPMSEVAGRLAIQAGASALERSRGGRGVLLGGVAGVEPGRVLIIGGGVVGFNAAQMAVGLGADVTVLDQSLDVLRTLERHFGNRVKTLYSTAETIEQQALAADLLIGAVLLPGAAAPKVVSADLVRRMKEGSAIVDVAIDQGGCIATSRPTTHADPTFIVDGVVHYCVANMPGAVARTSTLALNHATLPFVLALADQGVGPALKADGHLRQGLNICRGRLTNGSVAQAHGMSSESPEQVLADL